MVQVDLFKVKGRVEICSALRYLIVITAGVEIFSNFCVH